MNYKAGDRVLIDGREGIISGVYPNGIGVYVGKQHAYVWVDIPSLRFIDSDGKEVAHGRAVPFCDIGRRLSKREVT